MDFVKSIQPFSLWNWAIVSFYMEISQALEEMDAFNLESHLNT